MSTVKHVLLVATESISEKLDIPFEEAADLIRNNATVADTVLRELTGDALAIAEKTRGDSAPEVALFVAACEGITIGSLT